MTTLVAQIAPQRSTQYRELASALAPHELTLSALGQHITQMEPVTLGGQGYIKLEIDTDLDERLIHELGMLAATSAFFRYYDGLDTVPGPLLAPIDLTFEPALPPDLTAARRYRGKTNELFTHFLCNIARFSSDYAGKPWRSLTLADPLAGGGTTLFTALVLGADAVGVEEDRKDVESTAAFLKQYLKEMRLPHKVREDKLKQAGKRWWFDLPMRCVLGRGDTADLAAFVHGLKRPQLIVTDLPYGIQHKGELIELLAHGLPAWADVLAEGGVLAFAWDATRFPRDEMVQAVEDSSPFYVLNDPPYDRLAHRVDRVIKRRDVIVARLASA